jgi:light-regulated signal transduction histidine kinase (bacteriophytochrome)
MEVQIQAVAFEASLLSQKLRDRADRLKQMNLVLMFALIGVFGFYLLGSYYLVYQRTLRSIAELHTGTQIIGSGNLDFTIPVKRMDEIGELSLAFNKMTASLKEVTASKADLEREIAERQQAELKLERSNQELEQFAFVASHDLQEPLRKIRLFGNYLQQKLQGRLDEETQNTFERMLSAAERMQAMIVDLLHLSRVNRQGRPLVPIDLSKVAAEVVSDLEPRILSTGGQVVCELVRDEALPCVEADPIQIHQALQNLIGNGLKFHKPGTPPIVRVSSTVIKSRTGKGEVVAIQIEDNGIGFEEGLFEKILQPFQRLHSRGEYEGTGMGLAIVKKILERHQGEISARSTPGEGSTFIISLPVKVKSS